MGRSCCDICMCVSETRLVKIDGRWECLWIHMSGTRLEFDCKNLATPPFFITFLYIHSLPEKYETTTKWWVFPASPVSKRQTIQRNGRVCVFRKHGITRGYGGRVFARISMTIVLWGKDLCWAETRDATIV